LGLPIVLVWHLAGLQILPNMEKGHDFLIGEGRARTVRKESLPAYRGIITDRNGEILAVSTPVVSIYANPKRLDISRKAELANALNMTESALTERLNLYVNKDFVYLTRHSPPQEADKILSLGIVGVDGEAGFQRYYPAGEVTAHVVGFTDIEDVGQEGMELALNDWLQGKSGSSAARSQKMYFRANCRMRGSRESRITPKVLLLRRFVAGLWGRKLLVRL
jgi:cell division protein FtsI (penicillin-binding protein 3)